MNAQQMELTFDETGRWRPVVRRQPRLIRAQWFFEQMHKVVRNALRQTPPGRLEQCRFALPVRAGARSWPLSGYSSSMARASSASVL